MADIGAIIIIAYAVVQTRIRLTLVDVHVAINTLITEENKWKAFEMYRIWKNQRICAVLLYFRGIVALLKFKIGRNLRLLKFETQKIDIL